MLDICIFKLHAGVGDPSVLMVSFFEFLYPAVFLINLVCLYLFLLLLLHLDSVNL